MNKRNFGFFGCGFLATHIIPTILPFAETITLIDKDRIEGGNYDNAIFPKALNNTRKVTAVSNLVQILSSTPTYPIYKHVGSIEDIPSQIDFGIISFDNIPSRQLGLTYLETKNIPGLNVGMTENYGIVDWAEFTELPRSVEEIAEIEARMAEIADVCERIEFRTLGALMGAYTSQVIYDYLENDTKKGYILNIRDGVVSTTILHENNN